MRLNTADGEIVSLSAAFFIRRERGLLQLTSTAIVLI